MKGFLLWCLVTLVTAFVILMLLNRDSPQQTWTRITHAIQHIVQKRELPPKGMIFRDLEPPAQADEGKSGEEEPAPAVVTPKPSPSPHPTQPTPEPADTPILPIEPTPTAKVPSEEVEEASDRVFPVASPQSDVRAFLALSEEQVAALVPKQSGIRFTDCPACDKGSQDTGHFAWDPGQPEKIVCTDCGEVFPDNPKFPDNRMLKVRSFGETQEYPYHQRKDGYRLYFRAKADELAREQMAAASRDLARLWWETKEEDYAKRAAAILVRFAEVYPGYALRFDYPFRQKVIASPDHDPIDEAPNQMLTSKWTYWAYMGISRELAEAYDILRHWPPLAEMADGKAHDKIKNDLLGPMVDYVMGLEETYSNMSPTKWRSAIEAARVVNRPEVVHETVTRLETFLDGKFHYDGSWFETSPSYALQVWGNIDAIETALKGYQDPPGYQHPETGRILRSEDVGEVLARREQITDIIDRTKFPDGRLLPVNDTWADSGKRPERPRMEAGLFPGFGVAVMGGGEGTSQVHTFLNFTSGASHNQWSALSLALWAHGRELLSDIGYTHTAYRYWATSTSSHNTVTVDGKDQALDPNYDGNRLRLWASDGRGFHTAEAESQTAYPQTKRYRRTLMTVGSDAWDTYLVDVFQVHGGGQHDYILGGSADDDSSATLSIPLQPFRGTLLNRRVDFKLPVSEQDLSRPETGLGFIGNLSKAVTSELVKLDVRFDFNPDLGLRSWVDAGPQTHVFLGDAPSIRRAKESDAKLESSRMPMFVARRRGGNLRSTFVAVHEPVADPMNGIESVDVDRRTDAVVVTVKRPDATDTVLIALDEPVRMEVSTPDGPIQFDGRQGMVRVRDSQATEAHLVGGSLLSFGDMKLTATPSYTGKILETRSPSSADDNGWFRIEERLPEDESYSLLLVRLPDGTTQGYNVLRVEPDNDGSRIVVRENPSFDLKDREVQVRFFPSRTIKGGPPTYELMTAVHHP